MTARFRQLFPAGKPLIAMALIPPLPGTPLYDRGAGIQGLIDWVRRDLEILLDAGFDSVLFCNESDRPYALRATLEDAAVMTRIVTELAVEDRPFGVDFLCDARCALAVALATGAGFIREETVGVHESDMGLWRATTAELLRDRRRLQLDELAVFMTVTPEHASAIGSRSAAEVARSVAASCLPDALLVRGPGPGEALEETLLAQVREAVPDEIPVLINTRAKSETIARYVSIADGCIVGSDLKVDGYTWNQADPERARRFVHCARAAVA